MKNLISAFLIAFVFFACANDEQTVVKDGMLIHITHGTNDPHRALMGLSLAAKVSAENPVLVFLDITGPELVLKESTPMEGIEFGKTDELISTLMANNAKIIVCPMCLQKMNKTEDDLIAGVNIATKDIFFDFTDGRIVSLDY